MSNPRHPGPNRTAGRSDAARREERERNRRLEEDAARAEDFGAEELELDEASADPDPELEAAAETGFEVDTEEAEDISEAAERLAMDGEIDEETSEDYGVDNIVGPLEAGLGGGLDEQEEARLGITDEEIARQTRRRR